jgi:DNA-binding FrmR family transcriptional regulator
MSENETKFSTHLLRLGGVICGRDHIYLLGTEVFIVMSHPCHDDQLNHLKRIEGQVRGIQNMVQDGKYCIEILNQIKAVRNALARVEGNILQNHLESCLRDSLTGDETFDEKVKELLAVWKR